MSQTDDLAKSVQSSLNLKGTDETPSSQGNTKNGIASGPAMPPGMADIKSRSIEDVWAEMSKMPLFMTNLDDADAEGEENAAFEAIKALAYEGTRAEVAGNFREQGNEQARMKRWTDAKEFYDKALAALKAPPRPKEDNPEVEVVEVDKEAEKKKEKEIEEACYVNRALCNLEKKNYRSCNLDCAAALRLNPSNVKALYRSASACLALDKLPEAADSCILGLEVDGNNAPLKTLSTKIQKRREHLAELERKRQEREERKLAEKRTLEAALKSRGIKTRTTGQAPEMEDAAISLAIPLKATSKLSFPVILLYPVHAQSDFVKAFQETENLSEHLSYIFPLPWDEQGEYTLEKVECYMETATGGLIKAGKNLSLLKILGSGKVEVVDGLVRISVVPKDKAAGWIEEFKKRRGT